MNENEASRLRGRKTGFVFRELFTNQMQKLNQGRIRELSGCHCRMKH